jgi:hypothetical protein
MKRFIVILVIVLISIPLIYVVYGLTNNINGKSIGMVSNSKFAKPLLRTVSSSSDNPPANPNPFEDAMPLGVKGKVASIDTDNKIIKITEVKYRNPSSGSVEKIDLTIYYNQQTNFIKDVVKNGTDADIKIGEEIISGGTADFENREVKYAVTIFTGSFLPDGLQLPIVASGQIENLNKDDKSFTIDLSNLYENMQKVKVHINESTECFVRKQKNNEVVTIKLNNGFIPEFVNNGTLVDISMRLKYKDADAYADKVYFFESSAD